MIANMGMDYRGVIIAESLRNRRVLAAVRIERTRIEPVAAKHATPWLKQWTLHHVAVAADRAAAVAEQLSQALEPDHAWYADFKNATTHYIVYRGKVFCVDRCSRAQYAQAKQYGIALGIPPYQVDFSPEVGV